jgi:hypothetical protein
MVSRGKAARRGQGSEDFQAGRGGVLLKRSDGLGLVAEESSRV